jgi:lipoprotein NlpI
MFEQYILMAEADSLKNKNNLIDAYTYLAIYAVKKDDNETAKLYFTKILALDPENKTASEALKQLRQ